MAEIELYVHQFNSDPIGNITVMNTDTVTNLIESIKRQFPKYEHRNLTLAFKGERIRNNKQTLHELGIKDKSHVYIFFNLELRETPIEEVPLKLLPPRNNFSSQSLEQSPQFIPTTPPSDYVHAYLYPPPSPVYDSDAPPSPPYAPSYLNAPPLHDPSEDSDATQSPPYAPSEDSDAAGKKQKKSKKNKKRKKRKSIKREKQKRQFNK
jgi:hypothetical protein